LPPGFARDSPRHSYDSHAFVRLVRELGTAPHVTQNLTRNGGSAIDGRTTPPAGYVQGQHARPRIEPAFGWLKRIAGIRKVKVRGLTKVDWRFVLASAADNVLRIPKLIAQPA
jgi:hypothetical protein